MLTTTKPLASQATSTPPTPPPPVLAPCEYKTGRTLGAGSYATVKEAVSIKSGERFAVKVINKKLMHGKEFMILNEIDVLKKVSKGHKNIVTLWDYFETPNNLYLVMDLCTGGELFDRICEKGSFYEKDAAKIVYTIVDAVNYLHKQNIVHRDIKPENMLYKSKDPDSELVIADFGLSKIMDAQKYSILMTTCGTPGYMAPEVIRKSGHGKPVDMWSIGVLTYFLLCGYTPFDSDNSGHELHRILNADFAFEPVEYWNDVSDQAKDFIRHLLIVDPNKRLTAHSAMCHPWLRSQAPSDFPCGKQAIDKTRPCDLLPHVRKNFNARRTFKKAVDVVKMVQFLSHPNGIEKSSLHTCTAGGEDKMGNLDQDTNILANGSTTSDSTVVVDHGNSNKNDKSDAGNISVMEREVVRDDCNPSSAIPMPVPVEYEKKTDDGRLLVIDRSHD